MGPDTDLPSIPPPFMPSIWQLLWQMIRYAQRLYWVDTLLWLLILGLPAVPGLLIREFFDSLTTPSQLASPWVWIGLLLATGLARIVAIFIGRITKTQHRFLMSGLIRHNLLSELLKRPGAELATGGANDQSSSPGEILSYFRDDAFQIEDVVVGTNEILAAGVFAIASVALLLSVNATLTLLVFLPLCAIAALVHQAEHRLKRYRRDSRQATQKVTGLISEMFTACQAVKVAGAETQMLAELRERCDRRRQKMVRDQVFSALLNSGFENIVSLGTSLILLVIAQNVNTQTTLTVGDFALFIYYLSFVTYFLGFLGSFVATTKQSEVSFERMAGLIGEGESESAGDPDPPTHPPTYSSTVRLSAHAEAHSPIHPLTYPHPLHLKPVVGAQPPLPPLSSCVQAEPLQALRVEKLTYHYPGSLNGITDISLTLQRGSLTVITGPVGAGKTTLLRVLLGLLPKQAGRLYWNDQEITAPGDFLVPPQAAYTPQIPQLFSTSLRDNLLLGIDVETSEKLQAAIATAVFEQDVAAMPDGLETLVGTRGFRLSGGQKQRAAAARMLLRQPELLVFDDLSSALDVETEHRLWQQLFDMRRGDPPVSPDQAITPPPIHRSTERSRRSSSPHSPTCLVVSHRPTVLERADQVILLEAGKMKFLGDSLAFQQRFFDRRSD